MKNSSKNDKLWELEYKKLLNKKDPLDKFILELAGNNELRINIVNVEGQDKDNLKKYSRDSLPRRGKHTS